MSNLNLNTISSLDTGREVDVNRVMQTVDYVGGLVIDSRDTVIVDGDDRYVLAASAVLPYTTTGAGMPEGGAFVAVGDAALRQELADGTALVSSSAGTQTVGEALDRRVLTFNNVAAMQAVSPSLLAGPIVFEASVQGSSFVWNAADEEWKPRGLVNIEAFGAVPDGNIETGEGTDNAQAFDDARKSGWDLQLNDGIYRLHNAEWLITTMGQRIHGSGMGYARAGSGEAAHPIWQHKCTLMFTGEGISYRKTRRLPRLSAADPDDDPISVAVNIQHENVNLENFAIACYCDYSDASPLSEGANYDVGLMLGCRVGFRPSNVAVIGYWRKHSRLYDVTRSTTLPEFTTPSGETYPTSSVPNGADDLVEISPYSIGGMWGCSILGAIPTGTNQYYDAEEGLVSEGRGGLGFSDALFIAPQFFGPEHHSGRRRTDITGDHLTDPSGGAFQVDGRAGGVDNVLQGITTVGGRMQSREAFRVKLDRVRRVEIGSFIETGGSTTMDTAGNVINLNDPVNDYGTVTATTNTRDVIIRRMTNTPYPSVFQNQMAGNSISEYQFPDAANGGNSVRDLAIRRNLRSQGRLILERGSTVVVSSGAITATSSYIRIDGEGNSADFLNTINGGIEGQRLVLRVISAARAITLSDNIGNLRIGADIVMDSPSKCVELIYDSQFDAWHLVSNGFA